MSGYKALHKRIVLTLAHRLNFQGRSFLSSGIGLEGNAFQGRGGLISRQLGIGQKPGGGSAMEVGEFLAGRGVGWDHLEGGTGGRKG